MVNCYEGYRATKRKLIGTVNNGVYRSWLVIVLTKIVYADVEGKY
jgi:hypothetical protein